MLNLRTIYGELVNTAPSCTLLGPASDSREEVVLATMDAHRARWHLALRKYLHRDVFHLHFLLQVLLRVRLHAVGVPHPHHRHGLRHHRFHLFPPQLGGLSLAVDFFLVGCFHRWLCVSIRSLLLHHEDKDVR